MTQTTHSNTLIIGAGSWGCSIALELARRGYTSITVLDGNRFPSAISAGNDLNKIVEDSDPPSDSDSNEDYFWKRVSRLAMHAWKHDPIFRSFYHNTGFIMAAVGDEAYERCVQYAVEESIPPVPLNTKEDFQRTMPKDVLQGEFAGWRGFFKTKGAGWVYASGALVAMYEQAVRLGVRFVTGDAGKVQEILYNSDKSLATGVRTADGTEYTAAQTILAAGANSDLILEFEKQLRPTAWTLAHIPLSPKEAERYRNLPVLYGVDRGFFIEPDIERHEMKICDEHPGYINPVYSNGEMRSVLFARHQIPKEAESRMRLLLSETMPQLANRSFSFARICWDADTVDRIFLIDRHPKISNLVVAVGGSGNGFMACPAIGGLVVNVLQNEGEDRVREAMRWRPEISVGRHWWNTQGRYGGHGEVMDFRGVEEWTSI